MVHHKESVCLGIPVKACPWLLSYDVSHALAVRSRVRQLATVEQPKLCQCRSINVLYSYGTGQHCNHLLPNMDQQ